jgi:cyanophycin synthetase
MEELEGQVLKGIYNVVFNYMEEAVGLYAAKTAVKIAEHLIKGEAYDIDAEIRHMRELRESVRFGPSTGSIVDEAIAREYSFYPINSESLVQLGYGKNQVRFRATMTDKTSSIAVDLAVIKTKPNAC